MTNEQTAFCKNYNVSIIDDSKRIAIRRGTSMFVEPGDKDIMRDEPRYDTEPLLTITIPKSNLDSLILLDSVAFNRITTSYTRDLFSKLVEQKELEKMYRANHPAVQEAFERYSMLLSLVHNENN